MNYYSCRVVVRACGLDTETTLDVLATSHIEAIDKLSDDYCITDVVYTVENTIH